MKLTGESKLFLSIFVGSIVLIAIAAWAMTRPLPITTIARESLIAQDAHATGSAQATAYLVEFSDFECPACGAFAPTVKQLQGKYQDKLLFVFRHFPLPKHTYALPAAYAAEAASLQGKFWEAEEYLFAHQKSFSDTTWSEMAKALTLDESKFNEDVKSDAVKQKVQRDLSQARLLNLPGTPTFFLNGIQLKNILGPQDLIKSVEEAFQ